MKLLIGLMMLLPFAAAAQGGDALIGKWIKANKEDLIIEIYKNNSVYKGKIAWSKDKARPVGYVMLDGLTYNPARNEWEGGEIRDPESGRSYNADVSMAANGTIEVTGKLLLFSKSRVFKKVR